MGNRRVDLDQATTYRIITNPVIGAERCKRNALSAVSAWIDVDWWFMLIRLQVALRTCDEHVHPMRKGIVCLKAFEAGEIPNGE